MNPAIPQGRPRPARPSGIHVSALLGLLGILAVGLAVRVLLFPHGSFAGDAQTFRDWADRLTAAPLSAFYAAPGRPIDHLPGDLWILWGIAHLYRLFAPGASFQGPGFLDLLKLVPALADLGIGAVLFLIARRLAGPRAGLLAAALYVCNPAPIFVGAVWGQWDAVSALVMVIALWLVLRGSSVWALPVLTYAALIKPQLALLVPLVLIVWWRRSGWAPGGGPGPRRFGALALAALASVGVFLAVDLPFSVGLPLLPTRWTIVERLDVAWNRWPEVSNNAFDLWGILAHGRDSSVLLDTRPFLLGVSYQRWGEALLALAVVLVLALVWRQPDAPTILWTALAITLALFMLPTRIHERYLMPAVVLVVLVAALAPGLRWLAAALSLTCLVNVFVVYQLYSQHPFRFAASLIHGQPSDRMILATASVNLFLLLVVVGVGVALARRRALRPARAADAGEAAVATAGGPTDA